jgi:hypothetical protein
MWIERECMGKGMSEQMKIFRTISFWMRKGSCREVKKIPGRDIALFSHPRVSTYRRRRREQPFSRLENYKGNCLRYRTDKKNELTGRAFEGIPPFFLYVP